MDGWLKLKPFISGKLSTHKVPKATKGKNQRNRGSFSTFACTLA
jgi:hypothetical protein